MTITTGAATKAATRAANHGPPPWPGALWAHPDEPPSARHPTKLSIGVILCRRNEMTGRPEALLAHKRYTYAFAEFVHGRYARGCAGSNAAIRCVAPLFNRMTREELFDILSLNFEQMWYRIWLTAENRDLYNKKYAKFQSTFMRDDGGAALRRAVMVARAAGVLLWEVPRGRRLNTREADIICATRELYEETGVEKSDYRLLPGVKRRVSYVSSGTRYICAYYVAIANPHLAHSAIYDDPSRPTLREINYMAEVSEARWLDIEQIRLIDTADSRLGALVAPAFKLVKQYLKGNWASRRQPAVGEHIMAAEAAPAPVAAPVSAAPAPVSAASAAPVAAPAPASETPKKRSAKGARGRPPSKPGGAADAATWRTVGRPQVKKKSPVVHLTPGNGSLAPPAR